MAPPGSTTVILPLDLGAANKFEESNFPLAYYDGVSGAVSKGSLLLSATLDEMIKIKEMGVDLTSNPQFLLNTHFKYQESVVIELFLFHPLTYLQSSSEAGKIREASKDSQPGQVYPWLSSCPHVLCRSSVSVYPNQS